MSAPATPARTITLRLPHHDELPEAVDEPLRNNLSALELTGDYLWTASDETCSVERLVTADGGGSYGEACVYSLADFFDLPEGAEGEVDIEGLAMDGDYLWVTGSMAYARKKPKPLENDPANALKRLTEVKRDPNRWLLGRIPCLRAKDGTYELHREATSPDGTRLSAACLKFSHKHGNVLTRDLRMDEHLGRFLEVPAKENGFDVEGIAAHRTEDGIHRVFLGLRGPVLRGWAVVLELALSLPKDKPGRLRPECLGEEDERYAKHFLDLDGLGIRDLKMDGNDLLILAGPTMDLDGPVQIWRWPGALNAGGETVVPRERLVKVMDVPHGHGFDHAEGFCLLPDHRRLLVAYDNPGEGRLHQDGASVDLDMFDLP
ncbi:DUF3616 domain-containing protein [Indioceanicola profundi]|uniref:DUF3616 domain-containing protein n=1 Tax=Indioceanicola profundi TaxID=2220096 RepID=UPI0013C52D8C|nr:DUF3616 domain-containing protein [Indioceanicola profundi]